MIEAFDNDNIVTCSDNSIVKQCLYVIEVVTQVKEMQLIHPLILILRAKAWMLGTG